MILLMDIRMQCPVCRDAVGKGAIIRLAGLLLLSFSRRHTKSQMPAEAGVQALRRNYLREPPSLVAFLNSPLSLLLPDVFQMCGEED